jgi:hypothetical protein
MNMSHLLPTAQKPENAPKSKAKKKLESEEVFYTEFSREVFPLATPEGLEQRQNAKDELVAQSHHSRAERNKQFPVSGVRNGLDASRIEDAPPGLSKPAVGRQDTSPSASSWPGDKAQNSIDLASPTPTPSPEPDKQIPATRLTQLPLSNNLGFLSLSEASGGRLEAETAPRAILSHGSKFANAPTELSKSPSIPVFDREGTHVSTESLIITGFRTKVPNLVAEAEGGPKSSSHESGKERGPVPAGAGCLLSGARQIEEATSPKKSNTTRKRIKAALPGAADNLRFSSKHTEHPLAQQKRKRAAAEDGFIPNSPQTAEASASKKYRSEYPTSLGTNREPSSYNSPYPNPNPPAQKHKPRRFRNPSADDEDDHLPGPVERASIAAPIFRPINYEPATRRALPPSLSPTSHQRLHHLLVDILPADVSADLAEPGTTPQELLKAVETATITEVAKTRRVTVEAIDGLLATYGQRRDLLDGSLIMGFLENNLVVLDQVKKMTRCVQRYGIVEKWAANVGDGKNPGSSR